MDRDGNKKLVMANRKDKFATFYYTSQFKKGEKNLDFTILESESGAVFVYVRDDEHNFRGNIYMSDAHGKAFSLSMKNAIRGELGLVDFIESEGLEGVIIGN